MWNFHRKLWNTRSKRQIKKRQLQKGNCLFGQDSCLSSSAIFCLFSLFSLAGSRSSGLQLEIHPVADLGKKWESCCNSGGRLYRVRTVSSPFVRDGFFLVPDPPTSSCTNVIFEKSESPKRTFSPINNSEALHCF